MRVRAAVGSDDAEIDSLGRAVGLPMDARAERERAHATLLVATTGESEAESLLGFALGWVCADELEVVDIAVKETARRQGVGALLLRELLQRACLGRAKNAYLEVRAGNVAALKLYEAQGFSKIGERAHYYADGEDAFLLGCCLSGQQ